MGNKDCDFMYIFLQRNILEFHTITQCYKLWDLQIAEIYMDFVL